MHAALLLALVLGMGDSPGSNSAGEPVVRHCLVSLIEEAQVPGREAGVLMGLEAKEGMQVKAGASLGHVDDTAAKAQKQIKSREHEAEKEKATNDVNERFAAKASEVARAIWQKSVEANRKTENAVAKMEVLKLKLDWEKAELQKETAQLERRVALLTSETKSAEVDAAEGDIVRRQIKSPIDGVVVKVYRHAGEWVAPGDPVVRIVRIDRLRIEGFISSADWGPEEIDGRLVDVDFVLARGQNIKFPGKIVFVSPLVEAGGEYKIWAEVSNRRIDKNGPWILRPGLNATMTVHVKSPNQTAAAK